MNALGRSIMTSSCKDCDGIPKVPDAGRILREPQGDVQVMHNGLKVKAGGYHGDWMAQVIRALRGHHEPQEELIFHHLLRYARHNSLMVELGAFWAYYSLWYLCEVPGSVAVCVEPDPNNLAVGEYNASLNRMDERISFHQAGVGGQSLDDLEIRCESDGEVRYVPCLDMAALTKLVGGRPIEVLHMDTQGAELPFIQSMRGIADSGEVRFVVASTHHALISGSKTTHSDCKSALLELGAAILAEHDVQQSFSGDGLLVASFFPEDRNIEMPAVSLNKPHLSLFPD